MNRPDVPGMADPDNAFVPFEQFGKFHFARFVIIDDKTVGDLAHWGVDPIPNYPISGVRRPIGIAQPIPV